MSEREAEHGPASGSTDNSSSVVVWGAVLCLLASGVVLLVDASNGTVGTLFYVLLIIGVSMLALSFIVPRFCVVPEDSASGRPRGQDLVARGKDGMFGADAYGSSAEQAAHDDPNAAVRTQRPNDIYEQIPLICYSIGFILLMMSAVFMIVSGDTAGPVIALVVTSFILLIAGCVLPSFVPDIRRLLAPNPHQAARSRGGEEMFDPASARSRLRRKGSSYTWPDYVFIVANVDILVCAIILLTNPAQIITDTVWVLFVIAGVVGMLVSLFTPRASREEAKEQFDEYRTMRMSRAGNLYAAEPNQPQRPTPQRRASMATVFSAFNASDGAWTHDEWRARSAFAVSQGRDPTIGMGLDRFATLQGANKSKLAESHKSFRYTRQEAAAKPTADAADAAGVQRKARSGNRSKKRRGGGKSRSRGRRSKSPNAASATGSKGRRRRSASPAPGDERAYGSRQKEQQQQQQQQQRQVERRPSEESTIVLPWQQEHNLMDPKLRPKQGQLMTMQATIAEMCMLIGLEATTASTMGDVWHIPSHSGRKRHYPYWSYAMLVIDSLVMLYTLAVYGFDTGNLFLGPAPQDLINAGAKWTPLIRQGEWWRLFTPIFMHGGLIHWAMNMWFLYQNTVQTEQAYGTPRIAILYMLSGFGGTVMSAALAPWLAMVGASTSLFGTLAILAIDLSNNWYLVIQPQQQLRSILKTVLISVLIGMLPGPDNYAHIGGFLTGALGAVILLPSVQFGKWDPQFRQQMVYYCIPLLTVFLLSMTYLVFADVDMTNCDVCFDANCLPLIPVCEAIKRRARS